MNRKRKRALEYLKDIQYKNIDENNLHNYASLLFDINLQLEFFKEYKLISEQDYNNLKKTYKNRKASSEYQNIIEYSALENIFKEIVDVANKTYSDIKYKNNIPVFGTIMMKEFSARVDKSEDMEEVILISSGITFYSSYLSYCVSTLISSDENTKIKSRDIIEKLFNNTVINERLCNILLAYYFTNNVKELELVPFNNYKLNSVGITLNRAFLSFILAHEYSHILFKHLDDNPNRYDDMFDSATLEKLKENDGMLADLLDEHVADCLAIDIVYNIAKEKKYDLNLTILGIFICIISFEIFDNLNEIKDLKLEKNNFHKELKEIVQTHPHGKERKEAFKDQLCDMYTDKSPDFLRTIYPVECVFYAITADIKKILENIKVNINEIEFTDIQKRISEFYKSRDFYNTPLSWLEKL